MKELKKITIIGMGLLGASVSMAARRELPFCRVVGFSHRDSTRIKARQANVADEISDSLDAAVQGADLVILATPIMTFEKMFRQIARHLKKGAIVTDVGSTKAQVVRWADKNLPAGVHFVGSHPIAGSEKRGVDFSRDDLLSNAKCILTRTPKTSPKALGILKQFWGALGCNVILMSPQQHDRILGLISHLPHVLAAALVNASSFEDMTFAGKGFIDTSRIASGPADIWTDILLTNPANIVKGIDKLQRQLTAIRKAIAAKDAKAIGRLLENARRSRESLIEYKLNKQELI